MKNKIIVASISLSAILVFAGCKKNSYKITDRTPSAGSAQVKIGYFSAYVVLPPTQLYVNNERVSNTLTAPVGFPGGGFNTGGLSNGDYLWVSPGEAKIQGFIPVPNTGNLMTKLFEFTQSFDADKHYTFYVTDTGANTAGFSVPDTRTSPDSGFVRIKFVHAMPNVAALDVYKGTNNSTAVMFAANVPYKGYTADFDIPIPTDSFFVRPAGTSVTTAPIARRAFAANLTNQRIYTLVARGYNGGTGNLAPHLSVVINK